jgi:hypothetical protein
MMKDPDGYCKVWREFQTNQNPIIGLYGLIQKSKGWCDRITGRL